MLVKENIKYISRLSPLQEGIFYHHLLDPSSRAYFTQTSFHIKGKLDVALLGRSFQEIIDRYDVLRALFVQPDMTAPRQIVLKQQEAKVCYEDLRTTTGPDNQDAVIRSLLEKDKEQLFDLGKGNLLRVSLARLAEEEYYLIWSHHHILMDGWCLSVIIEEFLAIYHGLLAGKPARLPEVAPYQRYIKYLERIDRQAALQYWSGYLSGYSVQTPVPGAMQDKQGSYQLAELSCNLDKAVSDGLMALGRKYKVTLNTVIQSLWGVLLAKYNNTHDVVFGAVVSGRPPEIAGIEQMIGLFINTIPVRIQTDRDTTFAELLKAVQQRAIESMPHHYVQLADVQQQSELGVRLMDHIMIFENYPVAEKIQQQSAAAGMALSVISTGGTEQSSYDFNVTVYPGDTITIKFSYNANAYTNKMAEELRAHMEQLASALVQDAALPLRNISWIGAAAQQQLEAFSGIHQLPSLPAAVITPDLFEAQARATPEAVALVHGSRKVSYRELNEAANRIAHYLREKQQVKPGQLVGLMAERSPELVSGLLGIWKAGAGYVPLDAGYPEERIVHMLTDAGIRLVLTGKDVQLPGATGAVAVPLPAAQTEAGDVTDPVRTTRLPDIAYMIYTSGSTGAPKGVQVTHGNAAHFFAAVQQFGSGPGTVFPFVASPSFDISLFQLLTPLLSGGASLIADRQVIDDLPAFTALLQQATMIDTVPGVYNLVADHILDNGLTGTFDHIEKIFIGGDTIPDTLLQKLSSIFRKAEIVVTYGPTEGTIFCTAVSYNIGAGVLPASGACIGRPLPGSTIYILDKDHQLLPAGVMGEICIGGAGVSAGYFGQPELTSEKFVPDPFVPGGRIYCSGDLGRWNESGEVVFMGRRDTQVKIRGFRIETGEIERALLSHEDIREAVVMAREDGTGSRYLAAYLVTDKPCPPSAVRSYLSGLLPDYMLPGYYISLPQLPLTGNGKIDRQALPVPGAGDASRSAAYAPAGTETEERLVKIWEEVLGQTRIGIYDNFFEAGGHSLKAIQLVSRIKQVFEAKILLADIFTYPDVASQAAYLEQASGQAFAAIPRVADQESYPLSHAQRRLWILSQFSDGSAAYNVTGFLLFDGVLVPSLLEKVLRYVAGRHESLRTVFREDASGEVRQYVLPVDKLTWAPLFVDISDQPDTAAVLREIFSAEQHTRFDLGQGPLIRTKVVKVSEQQFALFYTMHHIISDGWSMEVLSRDVITAYNHFREGSEPVLAPLPLQYRDYAAWQSSGKDTAAFRAHERYWLEQLSGELPVLDLPADKRRPAIKTHPGSSVTVSLPPSVMGALTALCHKEGATLFMGLLAALKALFYRYTGQEDIIVGSPVAGREHQDLEDQIGLYVNSLALRTRFSGKDTFASLLAKEKQVLLDAYAHQSYPFDMLIEKLPLPRDRSRLPLFDIMVGMQNQVSTNVYDKTVGLDGLSRREADEMKQERSQFDLLFSFVEAPGGWDLSLTYNTDIYSERNVNALCAHYLQLLHEVTLRPQEAIDSITYLSAAEQQLLLNTFNDTAFSFGEKQTLHQRFEQQAAQTPDRPALIQGGRQLTYRELNERSNQLAHYLRNTYAILPGDLVAIIADRSELVIIGILAVLKAGAAYVPVDPSYPQERIRFMLEDAAPKLVLTFSDRLFEMIDYYTGALFALDVQLESLNESVDNPEGLADPSSLAYVIYTSGSTGQPKGVMVAHSGVVNMSLDQVRQFEIRPDDKVLQFASLSFDASVSECFMAFFSGASLVMISETVLRERELFIQYLQQHQITVITLPPAYLQLFNEEELSGLRVLITAGQEADKATALRFSKKLNYYNAYGPTENSVCATIYKVDPAMPLPAGVPIGKPIANNRIFILDDRGQLLPAGIPGEICIGGEGLALGYLHNSGLTASRFIENPYRKNERLYRTGDIGRWDAEGNLLFLGRNDQQVKIRGYRIELEEIEQTLLQYPGITHAVVQMRKEPTGEGSYLAAFIVAPAMADREALTSFMAARLPEYMVPAVFMQLAALPLTHNGKVDRKALPDPLAADKPGEQFVAPAGTLEIQLASLWQEVLGREQVGRNDHFFLLGGHSLKAMQLLSRIRSLFQLEVELNDLFTYPVLHEQAAFLGVAAPRSIIEIPKAPLQESYPLSHAQQRFWILSQFEEASAAYNVPGVCVLEGPLSKTLLEEAIEVLWRRHESLRTVFREDAAGNIRQYILDAGEQPADMVYEDISYEKDIMERLQQMFVEAQQAPFDLRQGPLLRIKVVKLHDAAHALLYTMHHIISDGWSLQVLIKEMTTVYNALKEGTSPVLPALPIQYKDFAVWQASGNNDSHLEKHRAYWLEQLSGPIPVLDLPAEKRRPSVKTHHGATIGSMLPATTVHALLQLCREEEASLFMGLLAGLKALFHHYTGQEDIIIGSPIAGRDLKELENQIGLYLNTLPLRTRFAATDTFRALLKQEREVLLAAYQHQVYPFDLLVNQLQLERNTSRSPLFDVLVIMQNQSSVAGNGNTGGMSGLQWRQPEGMQRVTSQFDLEFSFMETGDSVEVLLNYNTDIYSASFARNLLTHLELLLVFAAGHPEHALGMLDYLTSAEKMQQLSAFNNTTNDFPKTESIVSLFRRQASLRPEETAVVFEAGALTYRELDEQSDRVARLLTEQLHVQPGALVALMTERSVHLMAGMLGILKAGAAYVPLDPAYPAERISYVLEDCGARVLVAGEGTALPAGYDGAILQLETAVKEDNGAGYTPYTVLPEDLCYVIYTSGSTGRPKGVMVNHRNVVNFFSAMDREVPLQADDCLLAMTSTSFDISVLELLWTLCRGVQVVIHPSDRIPGNLDRYTEEAPATVDFSLFFFSSYDHGSANKYDLLQSSVRYADEHGFRAVWTPERHFHEFGGLYPNPSVIGAALAVSTRRLEIRSGSVVAPLHDTVRIAEEWAVVDNLSGGRVGLSFAPGWNANDFVLSSTPYASRHQRMYEQIAEVRRLWEGGSITRTNGFGQEVSLQVYPRPVQATLPVWVTAAGSEESFRSAGAIGAHVLTHLLGQDLEELAGKIRIYRESRRQHGHEGPGTVTVMLHAYLGTDEEAVLAAAEAPFISYLKSSIGLSRIMLEESGLKEEDINEELKEKILRNSYRRYAGGSALIGTRAGCRQLVSRLRHIGVNEVACLVDFGIAEDKVLQGLEELDLLRQEFKATGLAAHRPITMMQSTPSLLRLLEEEGSSAKVLGSLRALLLGGEPLPAPLLAQLRSHYNMSVYNMYGPTETTIWSCVCPPAALDGQVSIGRPVLNTRVYVLNSHMQLLPVGVAGELYIGGEGVTPGYLHREALTAERFVEDPFVAGGRLYRTGDLARWLPDGRLECLGRLDDQVKVRGHRIEPGEIEAVLTGIPGIREAVVLVENSPKGDAGLVACLVADNAPDTGQLRALLGKQLPPYMMPWRFVTLPELPLTPNGKTDRKRVKERLLTQTPVENEYAGPTTPTEEKLQAIWETVLEVSPVSVTDNFFTLGGQSLSGMKLLNMIRSRFAIKIGIADIFNAQTIKELALLIDDIEKVNALQTADVQHIEKEEIIL
ncbi:amino acid adenylation domain-containing protein [Chitinophaga oryzae]|uniref:Amino acid adenylation domain-containing protein n=1 Tax=Chitinophaga oryzae TaxID=2725414 RepID=A0ABX6LGS9_9BACT|nr:non-ribosomal peptide synthetase [Chitinophaga oryzae]QJB38093.1 amino acid adenylation domain-containing protein [Chitinophaga oryzae]